MVNHRAAAGRHDPLPLAAWGNPVSGKANPIGPVDPVVADHPPPQSVPQGPAGPRKLFLFSPAVLMAASQSIAARTITIF